MPAYPAHVPQHDVQARTVKGFCAAYGVGVTTVYALLKEGKLKAVKAGKRTLIIEASAQEWFSSLSHSVPMSGSRIGANGSERPRKRQYHRSRRSHKNHGLVKNGEGLRK